MTRLSRLWGSHWRTALGALAGASAGALYAHFIGCRSGTCPLTSSVWSAGLYGGLVGGVAGWPTRTRPPDGNAGSDPDVPAAPTRG